MKLPKMSSYEIGTFALIICLFCVFLASGYPGDCPGSPCSPLANPTNRQIYATLQILMLVSLLILALAFLHVMFIKMDFSQSVVLGAFLLIAIIAVVRDNGELFGGWSECLPFEGCSIARFNDLSCGPVSSDNGTLLIFFKPSNYSFGDSPNRSIVITKLSCTKKADQFEDFGAKQIAIGDEAWLTVTCNDESGKPMKFNKGDPFCGYINIEYYLNDQGPTNITRKSGQVALWAYGRD